jgi:2-iminoacetate synthase ThiH
MARKLDEDELYRLEEIYEEMVELLRQATDIVKATKEEPYWQANVVSNIFAEEFGYHGKSGGDYMREVIERLKEEAEADVEGEGEEKYEDEYGDGYQYEDEN